MVGAAAERPLGESSDIAARMAGPVGGRASARPCRCHLRYGRAHRPDERTWRREVISGEDHPIGGGIRSPLGKEPVDAPRAAALDRAWRSAHDSDLLPMSHYPRVEIPW